MSVCDKHIENPHECTGCEIELLHAAKQRLEADLALALKVPSVAAMHSYLDTECAKQNAQLGEDKQRLEGEVKALREALNTAKYRIEQGRVWNGMGWSLTGLHPHGQQKALDAIDAALRGSGGDV
jgi:hypothetical protein